MNRPKSDDCLNYTGGISKEPQSVGNKRETARRNSLRRAVWISSRGDKTAIELFRRGVIAAAGHLSVACKGLASVP
jgi:hypothetical protein